MRPAVINQGSQLSDLQGVLTGTWNEYDKDGWHIVVTPFFTHISATLDPGSHVLPVKVTRTSAMLLTGDGVVGACIVKVGQTAVSVGMPCLAEMTMWGASVLSGSNNGG